MFFVPNLNKQSWRDIRDLLYFILLTTEYTNSVVMTFSSSLLFQRAKACLQDSKANGQCRSFSPCEHGQGPGRPVRWDMKNCWFCLAAMLAHSGSRNRPWSAELAQAWSCFQCQCGNCALAACQCTLPATSTMRTGGSATLPLILLRPISVPFPVMWTMSSCYNFALSD